MTGSSRKWFRLTELDYDFIYDEVCSQTNLETFSCVFCEFYISEHITTK